LTGSTVLFVILFFSLNVSGQTSTLFKALGISQEDTAQTASTAAPREEISKNTDSGKGNDVPDFNGIGQAAPSSKPTIAEPKTSSTKSSSPEPTPSSSKTSADPGVSPSNTSSAEEHTSSSKNSEIEDPELTNIVLTEKGIRAEGWGEYRVQGRCLCCDNALDGDCIIVQSTNRTDKTRIKQIVDGKIEADTNDKATYFGDVMERENPVPANLIMAEITLKKIRDIYKVVVYTMVDLEKKKNFLSNCQLGYYDQFDRLQWAGKEESKGIEDHITFKLQNPILTKNVLLRVQGGKNRITEVALFCLNNSNKE
jgi:hypothetical protein